MLPDLHIGFSRGRSGGLVFPSLSEFSTIYCDPHSQSFDIVNKAEIAVFLQLSCFFHDPVDVGNLISGSSAFSNVGEMDKFLEKYNFPKLDQEEIENLNRPITSMEIEIRNLQQIKAQVHMT